MLNKVEYINKKISDLFVFTKGTNEFNRKTINIDKGDFPVYSGQTENNGIIGYSNKFNHDGNFIRIITVGDVGNITIIKGKFSLAQNNGILVPLKSTDVENLNLEYIRFVLMNNLAKLAKGEGKQKSLLKRDIDNFYIPLPVIKDKFDLNTQNKMVEKFSELEKIKNTLYEDSECIKSINIEFNSDEYEYKDFKVSVLFDLTIQTNGSSFTKSFIRANPGDIPVYGATKLEDEVGYGYVKDNAIIDNQRKQYVKYFQDCLTYNIDGSAGYVFYRKGKFSLSEKVRPLVLRPEYEKLIDKNYLKYIIQPIFRKNIKGRKGPNGENEFTKISKRDIENLLIPIPVNADGFPNLNAQIFVAENYIKLEKIKKNMLDIINEVLSANLEF